jgi:hypothetical protein
MKNKQQTVKCIGVWLDHVHARLVQADAAGEYTIETINSTFKPHERVAGEGTDKSYWGGAQFGNSSDESKKNNAVHDKTRKYYETIEKAIAGYDHIFLTGPTEAKNELFNVIMKNKSFDGKKVEVENADKLTDHQLIALVKDHFEKELAR